MKEDKGTGEIIREREGMTHKGALARSYNTKLPPTIDITAALENSIIRGALSESDGTEINN